MFYPLMKAIFEKLISFSFLKIDYIILKNLDS